MKLCVCVFGCAIQCHTISNLIYFILNFAVPLCLRSLWLARSHALCMCVCGCLQTATNFYIDRQDIIIDFLLCVIWWLSLLMFVRISYSKWDEMDLRVFAHLKSEDQLVCGFVFFFFSFLIVYIRRLDYVCSKYRVRMHKNM